MSDQAEKLRRATDAVLSAPTTESGLIVPPHVLDVQRREEAAETAQRPLNRAQRRRQAKHARSAAVRRHAAQRAARTPEQQEAVSLAEEAAEKLTEQQLELAIAFTSRLAKMTPLEREQAIEDFEREHGGVALLNPTPRGDE